MKTANLTLHCGAAAVERDAIEKIPTPSATATWQPIPHIDFVRQVESALTNTNMRVVHQAHSLTREGARYFGLLQVSNCVQTGEDYSYVLGLRNSHDMSFPAGLVVGAQVFVCDNLAFNGEIRISRKHTTHILRDLPALTTRAVGMLAEKWTTMTERIARYKTAEISDRDAHDFMLRAVDGGATTYSQLNGIVKEWRTPRHPEFADGKTAWRLFNAFTEIGKESGLALLPKRTIALHGLMDAQVGFASMKAADVVGDAQDAEVVVQN